MVGLRLLHQAHAPRVPAHLLLFLLWEQRLAPLAKHLADHSPVRARGYDCAFQRHLDLEVLREALSRMLCEQWDDGYLVFLLAIGERAPARVARELGVTQAALLDALRDTVADLSLRYEELAYQGIVKSEQERRKAKATGKRR